LRGNSSAKQKPHGKFTELAQVFHLKIYLG
jgi:hypothetical protein